MHANPTHCPFLAYLPLCPCSLPPKENKEQKLKKNKLNKQTSRERETPEMTVGEEEEMMIPRKKTEEKIF